MGGGTGTRAPGANCAEGSSPGPGSMDQVMRRGTGGSSEGTTVPAQCLPGERLRGRRHVLDVGVGADEVLDLVRVGVLEGEAAGADQQPLPVLGAEPIHDRQHLAFQLHHLRKYPETEVSRRKDGARQKARGQPRWVVAAKVSRSSGPGIAETLHVGPSATTGKPRQCLFYIRAF